MNRIVNCLVAFNESDKKHIIEIAKEKIDLGRIIIDTSIAFPNGVKTSEVIEYQVDDFFYSTNIIN